MHAGMARHTIRPIRPKELAMPEMALRATRLPSGEAVPVLGQGTWRMGEDRRRREEGIPLLEEKFAAALTGLDRE